MARRPRDERARRSWPQRLFIAFNVVCILGALAGAGSLAYAKRKVNEINRIDLANSDFVGGEELASDEPRNFLIVGADTDSGLDANDPVRAGRDRDVMGVRSDTIMIVRLDPATGGAKVLSLPRDLWVDIPGHSKDRINASLQFGGQALLIDTIKENFDIDINHYVQVDFAGFKALVKDIGGVPVYFATPVRDQGGLNVENAGCTTLDENGALQYVRARHLQYQNENGRWVSDPTSDLGRISRQQDFIKRVLRRVIAQGARNPLKLADFVDVGVDNITLDAGTTPGDLVALGGAFKNFDPDSLETFSLPVADAFRSGASVLDLLETQAEPTLAMFRGTGDPAAEGVVSPAAVKVQVLNGSGQQNQAADTSAVLAEAGFTMDQPNSSASIERTEVRFAPGAEAEAVLVARHLLTNPVLIEDPDVAEVTLVTGADFAAAIVDARPEGDIELPTTTTTTTTTTTPSETTVDADGSATTADPAVVTTSTTEPTGFVPEAAPAGVDCG